MHPFVPVPNFHACAKILKDEHVLGALNSAIVLFGKIKRATVRDENWDGYIGNMNMGSTYKPGNQLHDQIFHLWQPWRWALLCYAYSMRSECVARGIACQEIPPHWGHNLHFDELKAWQVKLREAWPFSQPVLPDWLSDSRLGRRHQLALAAIDPHYYIYWP